MRLTKTYEDGSFGVADNLPCGENSHDFKNLLINTLGKFEEAEKKEKVIEFLRVPDVIKRTGLKESTLYKTINDGLFPRQIKLCNRSVVWAAHEVEAINRATIAGKSIDEIKALVIQLEKNRLVDN